jgi:hypothetical protein
MKRTGIALAATAVTLTAAPAARAAPAVDGLWHTDGYGSVLAIDGGHLRVYETTAVSCLPGFSAERSGPATFVTSDGQVLRVRPGRLHIDGSPGDRILRRVSTLPKRCAMPSPTDPLTTFDVFWQTFAENYPFFAAKGVDWQRVRDSYRPQVGRRPLADILNAMIAPLNDAHTGVIVPGSLPVWHVRPGTTAPSPDYDKKINAYVERRDLHGELTEYAKGRIGYADLPGHLGYLRISGFTGYTDTDDFAANSAELERTLDAVLTPQRTRTLRGLVIDVRVNGGGDDELGLRVAARLTARPYVAYAKRAKNSPAGFTTPQPIQVRPAHAPLVRGPIALLTGGSTFSAGETFTQALMGRTPAPVRIGANTQGVFSDILDRSLPNGWAFGLPNEEFLTGGHTYDGAGIPPDVRTLVFTDEEFAHDRDSAFDRAVDDLS